MTDVQVMIEFDLAKEIVHNIGGMTIEYTDNVFVLERRGELVYRHPSIGVIVAFLEGYMEGRNR